MFSITTNGVITKPWADKPLALIPTPVSLTRKTDMWTQGASHMCNVHNAIFRGYNSIYLQAPHIKEADKADFVGYCLAWHKFVSSHADEEETGLFPDAEKLLGENVFKNTHDEHDAFLPFLSEFKTYLASLPTANDFSSSTIIDIMSRLQKPFEDHFRSEIDLIASLATHPNTPKEGTPQEAKSRASFERWGERAIIRGGLTDALLFFLYNLDRDYESGLWKDWPAIPGPVRWALINVGGLVHSGRWKFASCDSSGKPKELYASET